MDQKGCPPKSNTVCILTSSYEDSVIAAQVLVENGMPALACRDLPELLNHMSGECGALAISDDAISRDGTYLLARGLTEQQPWSDIPIVLITSQTVARSNEIFAKIGNVSFLEKPFSRVTLVRAMGVAIRARQRQYQIRDLLAALQKSKDEAERANTTKTEFLANMSHEIRTPIGAILGFLDLMKNPTNEPEENLSYMSIVERNSQQLLRLIDDILDLSKVESGKMSIERVQFSLPDLLTDVSSTMAFRASEKQIEFKMMIEGKVPDQIGSDPVRLRQIIGNIAGNAIKFTTRGEVRVTVSYEDPFLSFVVKDTGLGITREQEEKLFRPFSQADASTSRRYGGTGLGLVLSKRLSEALGGSLRLVKSEYGLGSEFEIRIRPDPIFGAAMVGQESLGFSGSRVGFVSPEQVLKGLKVLLVEDSPDNQMLITTYLGKSGAQVRTAGDGIQGYEMASRENFDVVLMDVQMPRMDGHAATQKLRQINYAKPIIALTAHAMNEERNRCFQSGFTDFLTKPIQRDHLLNVLARYVPKSSRI